MRFALNHMVAPKLSYEAFFDLAKSLHITGVEIRNDISVSQMDMASAHRIKQMADARQLDIISVNALQRFNEWNSGRAAEAETLAKYAKAVGAQALVMCPVNDTKYNHPKDHLANGLREALHGLAPILKAHGLIGLVEPLGFVECSLRNKSDAVAAIDDVKEASTFKLVHDTFHHYVAGEREIFPERTGLVHISGVTDQKQTLSTMRDMHRELVDGHDMIDNKGQVKSLLAGGYYGALSYEPFSNAVHNDQHIAKSLNASRTFLTDKTIS